MLRITPFYARRLGSMCCPHRRPRWTCITRTKPVAIVTMAVVTLGDLPMCAPSLFIVRL